LLERFYGILVLPKLDEGDADIPKNTEADLLGGGWDLKLARESALNRADQRSNGAKMELNGVKTAIWTCSIVIRYIYLRAIVGLL
jgi:hypothetical protein